MDTATTTNKVLKGGEFLIKESSAEDIFLRSEIDEEAKMIMDACRDFLAQNVYPNLDRMDKQEEGFMTGTLKAAGELGFLGLSLPEEYGGMGKDFNTNTGFFEMLGTGHAFSVAFGAHVGIGTLPILYFGTEEQKAQYLPRLATGEIFAAYCLTEPGSGSDALAAKTRADLSEDGSHYVLNGQKMWITNGGFADVFVVFAQIDGDKFTGFIVPRDLEGVSVGAEEQKMGIKGSSTCQVFFENVKVPKENVLGEIGKGHVIAFNILNIGRFKLCVGVLGGAKSATSISVKYANERVQFKMPISKFGAIKHKLGEQAIRTFVTEAATYRVSDLIDKKEKELLASGVSHSEALLGAAEEYAIECAMLKVLGSETLDYVVDEAVQVHGGYGFSEEYPAARAYRDSRINRIFEGTNEINRMLTVDMLLKRAMKGKLDLMPAAMGVQKELMSIPDFGASDDGLFAAEKKAVANMKKAVLMTAGAAAQKLMQSLAKEQEILINIADMCIDLYAAESALLATEKMWNRDGEAEAGIYYDMTRTFISDALERVNMNGKHALAAFAEGDELKMMLMGLKRFTKFEPVNTKELRRKVADRLIEANDYCF